MRLGLLLLPAGMLGQVFSSGSTGVDGDLNFPAAKPGDVIIFDPKDKTMFPPNGLDLDNDNVFHFKTITIPERVTVKLTHAKLGGPVYWLATGDVRILGVLSLDGEDGSTVPGRFAAPGPGGFFGGSGNPRTAGFGPGGGDLGCPGYPSHGAAGKNTAGEFLVPLIGGSGGGGNAGGHGGGAGGGAILIATNGQLFVGGYAKISARGGSGSAGDGGGGAGGSVRIIARSILGAGDIDVLSGYSVCPPDSGIARQESLSGALRVFGKARHGSPIETYLPPPGQNSSLRIVSVGGIAVKENPTGSFDIPDVIINTEAAVPIVIETSNVPAGTIVSMWLYSETAPAVKLDFPPLTGAGSTRRATLTTKIPYGFSRGMVRASFTR